MPTPFARKVRDGEPVLGTMVMYVRTPGIVRMAAAAGLDYVLIDLQHSVFGLETVADMCEVARAAGIAALVRPGAVSQDTINQLLDVGVDGLMLHDVTSRAQLEESVRQTRYAPDGTRGISVGGPASNYRPGAIDADLLRTTNEAQIVIAQIESQAGLDELESILESTGLDVIEIGRQDLSISLGVPGATAHPTVEAAVDTVIEACRSRKVAIAMAAGSVEEARRLVERGVAMVTWRTDKAILLDSYRTIVAGFSG